MVPNAGAFEWCSHHTFVSCDAIAQSNHCIQGGAWIGTVPL
jgi:hypothetical protein